ncbi:hypothetical protein [Sphingobacterium multivorum]|uniref:hypothetical protein n=1 Tax=Sphingobacterium multivorum TaxID=28454 RepID=UPI00289D9654|nr:hypothetical protein [Sphingobacterium multivorum]
MAFYPALHNQSVLDFVLQHTGSISGAVAFSVVNGISITDDLVIGQTYFIPEEIDTDTDISDYYDRNDYVPAGGVEFTVEPEFVIGRMVIEQSFIVKENG